MMKQKAEMNGSHNGIQKDLAAITNRLTMLPERAFSRELKNFSPVELHELVAFTAYVTAQPQRRRAKKSSESAPQPERTEASVRASLLKAYFDSMGEKKLDRELKKLSLDDLHLLISATAYENAKPNRKRR